MVCRGLVLGDYLVAVQRFIAQLGQPADIARFHGLAGAVLRGDASALLVFLHTARNRLVAHQAPPEVWDRHDEALSVVVDLAADGATFRRLENDLHRGLLMSYRAAVWE
ncbi:hypothetical protein [Streptoalloteichus hindustanus]|uniref:Uncharacterized protein n=1 Tax=Streptoalloteichus hindustanus TaxID=2017 RepID=A0A1M5I9J7_STRHI|nr:hypothetical protein [Streptoalloteichus hindustanus]SHG24966.1 hypothetical protein SAMN05444320_107180 [Streptoalloteichus hindustanus]